MTFLAQYAINKSKVLLGFVGSEWEQHIVAELDSALNKWIDSIPEHRKPPFYTFPLIFSYIVPFTHLLYYRTQCNGTHPAKT